MTALLHIHGPVRALMVLAIITPLVVMGPARAEAPGRSLVGPVTNGMIATFAWPPGVHSSEELDLVVMKPDGTGAQVLVPDAAQRSGCGFDLDWSPDGNRIAWASMGQVRTVNADGSNVQHLADGCVTHLEWSPDGGTLAVEIGFRTGLLTVPGGAFTWLRPCATGGGEIDASFSPDGTTVSTVSTQDCDGDPIGWGIYGFDVADGALDARYADTNLRGQPPNNYWDAVPDGAEWHPTQDLILMVMDDGAEGGNCHPLGQTGQWTNSDLFTVPSSPDSPLTKVGSTSGEFDLSERTASWSPDGQRILFTGDRNESCHNSSYVRSNVELYTMNANGSSVTKIWTPWNVGLGFVGSSWQPCTATTATCVPVPPPDGDGDGVPDLSDGCPGVPGPGSNGGCPETPPADTDGDGVLDGADGCPTVPGPASNAGCPLAGNGGGGGGGGSAACHGLTRADVLGGYLAQSKLSSFPNDDTMCAGLMLEGAEEGLVPQGLALSGKSAAWVTGYVPGGDCWVMRVDLASATVLKQQVGITAKGGAACSRAGGAVLNKYGLWVADKHHLWLLNPRRIGKPGAVKDHWALSRGADATKRIKGSFLLEAGGRLGIGQHGKSADKILMFRISQLRKKTTQMLVAREAGPGEAAPKGVVTARKRAQGATKSPGGKLYVAASTATCGLVDLGATRQVGFAPGVEDLELTGSGRVWAVFQASTAKNVAKTGVVVPMLAEFDATRLFAASATPASC